MKYFIFGGSGSLGLQLIKRNIEKHTIVNYSRDECKHWNMEQTYKYNNLRNIIGDIRDKFRVQEILKLEVPDIIVIASAMKHVDRCEYSLHESIQTNIMGVKNIIDVINENDIIKNKLKTVIHISTDKACSPINVYGMCKALAEKIIIEQSKNDTDRKYCIVRYGNVLNSRGSIIPFLHNIGKDITLDSFTITHPDMTRFVMTLDESCELIEYTIKYSDSGSIIIPKLKAMKIIDLFEIFSDIYKKPVKEVGLRVGEKLYESLINGTQYLTTIEKNNYYHIIPPYKNKLHNSEQIDYNSTQDVVTKSELMELLNYNNLLDKDNF